MTWEVGGTFTISHFRLPEGTTKIVLLGNCYDHIASNPEYPIMAEAKVDAMDNFTKVKFHADIDPDNVNDCNLVAMAEGVTVHF